MITVIEPCCYSKQLTMNLEEAEKGSGICHFYSFSDWGTDELIPWVLGSVPGCDATICLVKIDFRTIYMIAGMLRRTYFDRVTNTDRHVVNHLTIITQTPGEEPEKQRNEFRAQLGEFVEDGRVTICEDHIGFRCVTAGNGNRHIVIQGSLNQLYTVPYCQMYTMTTTKDAYAQAMALLHSKSRIKRVVL